VKDNFNAIRLGLSVLVIFSHSFAVLDVTQPDIFDWTAGTYAVQVFFAISGYFITASWVRNPSLVDFALNRALRILPGYVAARLLGRVLFTCFDEYQGNPLPLTPNNSLWTIPWEATCYALCAIAGTLGLLTRERYNAIFAVICLLVFLHLDEQNSDYTLIIPMMLSFLVGGMIFFQEPHTNMKVAALCSLLAIGVITGDRYLDFLADRLTYIPLMSEKMLAQIEHLPIIVATAFCAIYLGKYAPCRLSLRQDYSYGMYFYAWPVQQSTVAVASMLGVQLGPYALTGLSIPLTLCLAAVSWHVIEKPVLRRKRKPAAQAPVTVG